MEHSISGPDVFSGEIVPCGASDAKNNTDAPIRSLPDEVLSHIFELGTDSTAWESYSDALKAFGLVSSRWYQIIVSTPRLWRVIIFRYNRISRLYPSPTTLQRHLDRSKNVSLDLTVNLLEVTNFPVADVLMLAQLLKPHLFRCSTCNILATSIFYLRAFFPLPHMPLLKTFQFCGDSPYTHASDFPIPVFDADDDTRFSGDSIKELTFHSRNMLNIEFPEHCTAVRKLDILVDKCKLLEWIFKYLNNCLDLEELAIWHPDLHDLALQRSRLRNNSTLLSDPLAAPLLPSLRCLRFHRTVPFTALRFAEMPTLEELKVTLGSHWRTIWAQPSQPQFLPSFPLSSCTFPSLRILDISGSYTLEEFTNLTSGPNLEEIRLSGNDWNSSHMALNSLVGRVCSARSRLEGSVGGAGMMPMTADLIHARGSGGEMDGQENTELRRFNTSNPISAPFRCITPAMPMSNLRVLNLEHSAFLCRSTPSESKLLPPSSRFKHVGAEFRSVVVPVLRSLLDAMPELTVEFTKGDLGKIYFRSMPSPTRPLQPVWPIGVDKADRALGNHQDNNSYMNLRQRSIKLEMEIKTFRNEYGGQRVRWTGS